MIYNLKKHFVVVVVVVDQTSYLREDWDVKNKLRNEEGGLQRSCLFGTRKDVESKKKKATWSHHF